MAGLDARSSGCNEGLLQVDGSVDRRTLGCPAKPRHDGSTPDHQIHVSPPPPIWLPFLDQGCASSTYIPHPPWQPPRSMASTQAVQDPGPHARKYGAYQNEGNTPGWNRLAASAADVGQSTRAA